MAWLVVAALVAIAALTWKFGRRFLVQFFISPFQFFIIVPNKNRLAAFSDGALMAEAAVAGA